MSDTAVPSDLILAADIGASASHLAIGPAGALPAPVDGPGAEVRSDERDALASLTATVRTALASRPAERIERAVLAVSGAHPARRPAVLDAACEALAPLGVLPRAVTVIDDLTAAFLTADVGGDGVLLRSGTGAVAARFRAGQLVERVDGMGWLLGDVLGLELRDGIDTPTGDARRDLIRALDPLTPTQWGRFAPLPGMALPDPVARKILDRAVRALAHDVQRLDPEAELPVVLAGSVLTTAGPLHDELMTGLDAAGHPRLEIAASGLAGAWEIAMRGGVR